MPPQVCCSACSFYQLMLDANSEDLLPEYYYESVLWALKNQVSIDKQLPRRKWNWLCHTLRQPIGHVLNWNPKNTRKRSPSEQLGTFHYEWRILSMALLRSSQKSGSLLNSMTTICRYPMRLLILLALIWLVHIQNLTLLTLLYASCSLYIILYISFMYFRYVKLSKLWLDKTLSLFGRI